MAGQINKPASRLRKSHKKKKSRTEVSSSSDTDSSDGEQKTVTKSVPEVTQDVKVKEKSKKKSSAPVPAPDNNGDITMVDRDDASETEEPERPGLEEPEPEEPTEPSNVKDPEDEFSAIYLRKITGELADDLDKVREANDFTTRSLPMLIHALKQGEGIFSAEEKRRVVGAANA